VPQALRLPTADYSTSSSCSTGLSQRVLRADSRRL